MRILSLFVLLFPAMAWAQSGLVPGTAMWVEPGTSIVFEGSQSFALPTGASLTNDGVLEFGPQSQLIEDVGSPVSGLGTETTTRTYAAPLAAIEPAGLGLALTTTLAPGNLTLTRGHLPFTDNGGLLTVERWFNAVPAVNTGLNAVVAFRVDPTELNGLTEANLILHAQGSGNYWTSYPGTVDLVEHRVTATGLDSLGVFSLFAEISTGVNGPLPAPTDGNAWMKDHLLLVDLHAPVTDRVDVIDVNGRTIATATLADGRACIDLSEHAAGVYIVRSGTFRTRVARP